jgi:hypothetical protein
MEEMHFHGVAAPGLPAIFAAARCFGLSDEAVWQTASDVLDATGGEPHADDYADEVAGALARRILAQHRAVIARQRGIPIAEKRRSSEEHFY